MPGATLHKKNKIIRLLKEGETSSVVIANKLGCAVAYVYQVKQKLLHELPRPQQA